MKIQGCPFLYLHDSMKRTMNHRGMEVLPASEKLESWIDEVGITKVLAGWAELCVDSAAFVVDSDHRVLLWNAKAEELLGFSAQEVVGQHCLHSNRCENCMAGCALKQQGQIRDKALILRHKDGSRVEVSKHAQAFYDQDGKFLGGVEMLRSQPSRSLPVAEPKSDQVVEFEGLVSRHASMMRVFQIIRNVAETDTTALIRGESGTGKELAARALHRQSHRKDGPFLAINCAALTPTLLESELFGHVKGAFTGAVKDRQGLFAQAQGGTIFLDEVAELSMDVQAKLLRVLEEREVVPVGSGQAVPVDVRVIAATHRSLRKQVANGKFREDLMYRLRVVPIFLPALRQRVPDIESLLWHFIEKGNRKGPRRVRSVEPEVMRVLLHHPWPGNIRELRNVVEYVFAVGRGESITMEQLPPDFHEAPAGAAALPNKSISSASDAQDERSKIAAALAAHEGNIGQTAQALGISRPTLWRKRKKYGL